MIHPDCCCMTSSIESMLVPLHCWFLHCRQMSVAPWLWWVSCWRRGGSRRRGIRRGRAGRYCCEDKWHEDWLRSLVLIELLHRPRKSWNVRPCHCGFSIARWLLALSRVEKSTEKVKLNYTESNPVLRQLVWVKIPVGQTDTLHLFSCWLLELFCGV